MFSKVLREDHQEQDQVMMMNELTKDGFHTRCYAEALFLFILITSSTLNNCFIYKCNKYVLAQVVGMLLGSSANVKSFKFG